MMAMNASQDNGSESASFEIVSHTADVAIRVVSPTLTGLFAAAARGMFSLVTDLDAVQPTVNRHVTITGPDWEVLLVEWLNELLFLQTTQEEVYSRFEITELEANSLVATAWGERDRPVHLEIKAATYHGLTVHQEDDLWQATVLFDI
jgi:SHS2 domain-containing protein